MLTFYTLRVVDDAGALVPGATLTTLAVKRLSDGVNVAGAAPAYVDLGNGDYSFGLDVDANPEALVQVGAAKAGSTISGQNAIIPVVCARTVLSATGLDCLLPDVASDADLRASGAKMLRGLFNRFYNKATNSAAQQQVCNDASNPVLTLPVSDDGTTAIKGRSA